MNAKNFNPQNFIDKVRSLYGDNTARPNAVTDFANFIGDDIKLNNCLLSVNFLTHGLSQEKVIHVFSWLTNIPRLLEHEERTKAMRDKKYRKLKKENLRHFEKIKKAIELIKTLEPAKTKFNENYLLNLAKQKTIIWKVRSPFPQPKMFQTKKGWFLDEQIATTDREEGNPKGSYIINNFIYGVYETVKESNLTENKKCSHIGRLLKIITGKKYSRQNVRGILSHPVYLKDQPRFRSWPK
jgi:hypothetical protein